ncbi:NAD-dependent dihydropyrimidine dehydrogenase PreA subunit [Dysgonomonas hofstadii]|uniref:NAD-dependent dihydropyrimidine dehydrogenase PreA subunit n=1 Tax=Dysgonomonas hofstadii TaxID=637886 RepID=A0A840CK38_9BACT|nr:4Fe-4S dicluster domain-containing protein [Dysgonomonas hofstadii]MBB4036330.1 NAD-dependent dihydropyrimidine dehydrogenase PreA subunit [Dysgonomonas hofstadii]
MKRTVIKIDEELCNGCGACVTGCHEGALQLVDGKAVMISDLYCDGLGACIGECPVGAIFFEEREAEPYSEEAVIERMIPKGENVILAHLNHLKEHGEITLLQQGLECLKKHNVSINFPLPRQNNRKEEIKPLACGCPGSMMQEIKRPVASGFTMASTATAQPSELRQFPVQLHLLNPNAGFLQGADLLLAADCTAFAYGGFHSRFLKDRALAIACPKLDSNTQVYVDKLVQMIDEAGIDTLTVLIMEVPCCSGLIRIAQMAREQAERNVPMKVVVISVQGEIKKEEWI